MTLGECINNYLNEHDMSMRKFASAVGISHAYISNIVNEKTSRGDNPTPSITVYKKIASAMGIDVNTLIAMVDDEIAWGEQKEPATNSDGLDDDSIIIYGKDKHLLEWFRSLPEEKQRAILISQDAPEDLL